MPAPPVPPERRNSSLDDGDYSNHLHPLSSPHDGTSLHMRPPHTPRRAASSNSSALFSAPASPTVTASAAVMASSSSAQQTGSFRIMWLPLLPLSSGSLHAPLLYVADRRGHPLPFSLSLWLRALCQLQLPLSAFLLLLSLLLLVVSAVAFIVLRSYSLSLSYTFTSPPHPVTSQHPYEPLALNRTDAAGRRLHPDTLAALLARTHTIASAQTSQRSWMLQQAGSCALIIDLCHARDHRYVKYKLVDQHQRPCLLYRVRSKQTMERLRQEEAAEQRRERETAAEPQLTIIQTADDLPFVLSYVASISSVVEYAEAHGYGHYIRLVTEAERRGRHASFGRVLAAYEMLHLLPQLPSSSPSPPSSLGSSSPSPDSVSSRSQYLFYLDLDAYVNTSAFLRHPLSGFIVPGADLQFQGEDTFCAAVFLLRLSSLSLHFLEHVWSQGQLDYTRRHTWEQKAFTHTVNLLLSGRNGFHYSTACLVDSCEPLNLRSYRDDPSPLWRLSWGAVAFWPLNTARSLSTPQLHECVWNRCPQYPGLVVHNGDHSNDASRRWTPDPPRLPPGVCEDERAAAEAAAVAVSRGRAGGRAAAAGGKDDFRVMRMMGDRRAAAAMSAASLPDMREAEATEAAAGGAEAPTAAGAAPQPEEVAIKADDGAVI